MAKFLIVDDHPLFQEALISAITAAFPAADVTEIDGFAEALEILNEDSQFDLALLDLILPDTSGLEGFLELRTRFPSLPIAVISGQEDPRIVEAVIAGGAAGYIPKSIKKDALTLAISTVMEGEIYTPQSYRSRSAGNKPLTGDERSVIIKKLTMLTPQQLRVIRMIRDGLLNKQIAYELNVGETTVKAHVSEILKKLEVNNRTQAAMEFSKLSNEDFSKLSIDDEP